MSRAQDAPSVPRVEGAEPPTEHAAPRQSEPASVAGGLPAVRSAMAHAVEHAGLVHGTRALLGVNQRKGFDCPGCAWPDPEHRSAFEFCENGAKAIASEVTRRRADAAFFAQHSVEELLSWTDRALNDAGRLTEPLIREVGATHYAPISWDAALSRIALTLRELESPDEAVFYTSGRTSNEAAFLYQLFVRSYGTNNLPDCSNMCHESSGTGLGETIGIGKGTVTLEDFDQADLIIVIGQNPGTNHPRMLTALQRAARKGAHIVSVNPLREAGLVAFAHPQEVRGVLGAATTLAETNVPVRVNGDVALLNGVMKAMLALDEAAEKTRLSWEFIRERTEGFEAFAHGLVETSWEALESGSGIRRDEMEALAERALASDRTIVCWAMGLTQHENGVANVQSVVNLLLLGGHFGRPGAGACPVRGHSNVQGDRTMGIWERPPPAFLDRLEARFEQRMPRAHGYDTVEAIEAMGQGAAKVFFAMGGNFLSAAPDTHVTAAALQRCRLTVAVSTKLNRGHLVAGETAIILPCRARSERDTQAAGDQFVTVENSMGFVHASRGTFAPASDDLWSEVAIVSELAARVVPAAGVAWRDYADDYRRVRSDIAACIPGFEDFEARVHEGGFYLPNGPREGRFDTPNGRALFTTHAPAPWPCQANELLMMTLRSHDQYNTTVYGDDDRYRGIEGGRRVVLMHEEDIGARGLSAGDVVDLRSNYAGVERRVERFFVLPYAIPRGCCATYFPEANPLVPLHHVAKRSRTPASKSIRVTVGRHETA